MSTKNRVRTTRWVFAAIVLSLLASTLLQRYVGHVMSTPDLDFYDYYFEAAMVRDHPRTDMYAEAMGGNAQLRPSPAKSEVGRRSIAAGFESTQVYDYPPMLADLLVPVAALAPRTAAAFWRVFNLAIVLVACAGVLRWLRLPVLSAEAGLMLFTAYSFWPVHETIMQGQISIVLLALWVGAILFYVEERVLLSAALLALATWLKVTPVLIVPVFFIWKDYKWLRGYLASCTAFGLMILAFNGWHNLAACVHVLAGMSGSVPAMQNKCIGAMLSWIYYGKAATYDEARPLIAVHQPAVLLALAKVTSLSFYAVCLALVWLRERRHMPILRSAILAVFPIAIALTSPVSWRHGYSCSLILFALLWIEGFRTPPSRLRLWLLALNMFTTGSLFFDLAAQAALPQPLKIVCASVWVVTSALLCFEVLRNGVSLTTAIPGSVERVSPA